MLTARCQAAQEAHVILGTQEMALLGGRCADELKHIASKRPAGFMMIYDDVY